MDLFREYLKRDRPGMCTLHPTTRAIDDVGGGRCEVCVDRDEEGRL